MLPLADAIVHGTTFMTRTNFTILWFFLVDVTVKSGGRARLLSKVFLNASSCDAAQVRLLVQVD